MQFYFFFGSKSNYIFRISAGRDPFSTYAPIASTSYLRSLDSRNQLSFGSSMRTPSALKYGQNDNFSLSSSLPSSYYKKYFETDYNHHNQPSIRSESYFSSSRYEPRSILLRSFDPKASYISDMESRAEMQKGISKPSIQGFLIDL